MKLVFEKGERVTALDDNGEYLITNFGRVYSVRQNKFLTIYKNATGYNLVGIWSRGKRKHVFVHVAVVEHFGDKDGTHFADINTSVGCNIAVDHIDKNKDNCRFDNLQIVTQKENNIRAKYEVATCKERAEKYFINDGYKPEPLSDDFDIDDIF